MRRKARRPGEMVPMNERLAASLNAKATGKPVSSQSWMVAAANLTRSRPAPAFWNGVARPPTP